MLKECCLLKRVPIFLLEHAQNTLSCILQRQTWFFKSPCTFLSTNQLFEMTDLIKQLYLPSRTSHIYKTCCESRPHTNHTEWNVCGKYTIKHTGLNKSEPIITSSHRLTPMLLLWLRPEKVMKNYKIYKQIKWINNWLINFYRSIHHFILKIMK